MIIIAMFDSTVVTCLCSEASEASPRVNCIFHKYQKLRNNYCKAFECLKAHSIVNGTNSEKQTWNSHAFFMCVCLSQILSCSSNPLETAFFPHMNSKHH